MTAARGNDDVAPGTGPAGALSRVGRYAAILVALAIILPLAWLKPVDGLADAYVQDGLKRALVTFAIARTANGVISVIQESTVNVTFVVGGTLAAGQILDPLNDLVEQFSTLMMVASVSFATQAALMAMGETAAVTAVLTLLLAAWSVARWTRRKPPRWLARALVLLLVARFAVPLAAIGSELAYQALLAPEHQAAQARLGVVTSELEGQVAELNPKEIVTYAESLKTRTGDIVENTIRVMAVYLVQTVILPLLFLWLVVWLAREFVLRPAGPRRHG